MMEGFVSNSPSLSHVKVGIGKAGSSWRRFTVSLLVFSIIFTTTLSRILGGPRNKRIKD